MRIANPHLDRFLGTVGAREVDDDLYAAALEEVRVQHPEETPEEQAARAAYRVIRHVDRQPREKEARRGGDTSAQWRLPWWVVAWGIAILLLLGAIAAKAEPNEPRSDRGEPANKLAGLALHRTVQGLAVIRRAMTLEVEVRFPDSGGVHRTPETGDPGPAGADPQQPSGIIIQLRNQGTVLATRPAGLLILNCSTNMSCSMTGSTFNITSSSTASTAFSALTASLNTNAGTFSASGNSWDFTAATIFKVRAAAGATTSANGDLAFDSTASRWHIFQVSDRLLIPMTNVGVAGQAALSNADGTATFADPIVSGPAAEGVAPVNNPVWTAGTGTDGNIRAFRLFDLDSGAGAQWAQGVNLRKIASGGSVEAGTASDPLRVDPTGTTIQPVLISAANFPDNEPFNQAQVAGTAVSVNRGAADAGTQRVVIARDSDGCGPDNTSQVHVNVSASGNTQLVALVSGQTIYVCKVHLMANGTVTAIVRHGTGTACGTGTTDMDSGDLTAQTGWVVSWDGTLKTASGNALCINLSAAVAVRGAITYRQATTF